MSFVIDRQKTLAAFESVQPGLAAREMFQQSTCLVFLSGRVWTFNDVVACSHPSGLPDDFEMAVPAKPFIDLLSRMTEEHVQLNRSPGELEVRGKRKKSGLRIEEDVLLPIKDIKAPKGWTDLPDDFIRAVELVHACAGSDSSEFVLTCIHIHPDYLEATDRHQIGRYPIKTGIDSPTLIRAQQLKEIIGVGVTKMSLVDNWLHFKNEAGLVMSFRRDLLDFPDMSGFMSIDDTVPLTLPGGLEEVCKRTSIFSRESTQGDLVSVTVEPNRVIFGSEGAFGWYKEMKEVAYSGPSFKFLVAPSLLLSIANKSNECRIGDGKLCIAGAKFQYVTATYMPADQTAEAAA